jgi:hypothetical protein
VQSSFDPVSVVPANPLFDLRVNSGSQPAAVVCCSLGEETVIIVSARVAFSAERIRCRNQLLFGINRKLQSLCRPVMFRAARTTRYPGARRAAVAQARMAS